MCSLEKDAPARRQNVCCVFEPRTVAEFPLTVIAANHKYQSPKATYLTMIVILTQRDDDRDGAAILPHRIPSFLSLTLSYRPPQLIRHPRCLEKNIILWRFMIKGTVRPDWKDTNRYMFFIFIFDLEYLIRVQSSEPLHAKLNPTSCLFGSRSA